MAVRRSRALDSSGSSIDVREGRCCSQRRNRTAQPNQRSAGNLPDGAFACGRSSGPPEEGETMASKGILGRKIGMTQVWDEENRVIPVTVIQAGPCHVTQLKTPERDGYAAVQLAFGETKSSRLNKPELGHLAKSGVVASKHLVELRVADLADFAV